MRRRHTYINMYVDLQSTQQAVRLDRIFKLFNKIVDIRVESDERCHVVMAGCTRERIDKFVCDSNKPSVAKPSDDDCRVLSPIDVHAKGRPPFKQKVSKVDVAVQRKKKSVKEKLYQQQKGVATPPEQQRNTTSTMQVGWAHKKMWSTSLSTD